MGTSGVFSLDERKAQDHPHACGDKTVCCGNPDSFIGSSPRVWGQVFNITPPSLKWRIIPTRVGTRNIFRLLNAPLRDHPHACGDKARFNILTVASLGSSPRVWGQVIESSNVPKISGIIPTRVGTSLTWLGSDDVSEDHPHACGDKLKINFYSAWNTGSSPRVWGQARLSFRNYCWCGIIPTRVGTSNVKMLKEYMN